jgi:hypothetical protein
MRREEYKNIEEKNEERGGKNIRIYKGRTKNEE